MLACALVAAPFLTLSIAWLIGHAVLAIIEARAHARRNIR